MSLGKTIKKLRERQNLERSELAKSLGITYHALSKYETDEREPDYDVLVKIANFFNVTIDYLLGRTEIYKLELEDKVADINGYLESKKDIELKLNQPDLTKTEIEKLEIEKLEIEQEIATKLFEIKILNEKIKEIEALSQEVEGGKVKEEKNIYSEENAQKYFPGKITNIKKLPILGIIRAGKPLFAEQNVIGYEFVDAESIKGGEFFFLKVTGDSMIGSRIQEGDLVLVRRQAEVENGEIAIVMVNSEDATLKRVYKQDNQIVLQADNPNYPPKVYKDRDVRIVGKVVKVEFKAG